MPEPADPPRARDVWESAAPGWAKWEETHSGFMSDATDRLIRMAHVGPGMRVLDLACGAGTQSVDVARRVGPRGRVLASDISATMLQHVRSRAIAAGLANIETLEGPAEDLDDSQGPFDAAICRMSLMHFPSPPNALRAVRRVLRPGARFSTLVFTTPARNPFMSEPMAILLRHAGKPPPPPGQPGIFALGAEGVLAGLFRESGFADVQARAAQGTITLPDASSALTMMQEAFGAYRATAAGLGPDERARAWEEVRTCLRQFQTDRGFEAGLDFLIVSGARAV